MNNYQLTMKSQKPVVIVCIAKCRRSQQKNVGCVFVRKQRSRRDTESIIGS